MDTLIHALEPSRSILGDSTSINNSLNTVNATPEFSSDDTEKKFPIFNNCNFNNVTFKF